MKFFFLLQKLKTKKTEMVSLNFEKLTKFAVAALLVIAGVVMKNGSEQWTDAPDWFESVGPVLFLVGWVYAAVVACNGFSVPSVSEFTRMSSDRSRIWSAVALILVSVYFLKGSDLSSSMQMLSVGAFVVGWLLFGHSVGSNPLAKQVGLLGALFVIASMVFILPWQRPTGYVDGPGMPMFTGGWAMVALAASLA